MDELTNIDLSSWRVRELPAHFVDDVIARLDALDERLADELEVIDDELEASLHVIDDELESLRVRTTPRTPSRTSGAPWMLGIVLAAAAAALVWMWPEPPVVPPALAPVAAPPPTIAATPQPADLDRGGIRRAVAEQFVPKARACYNELQGREPAAEGRVTLRFGVVRDGERGVVDTCTIDRDTSEIDDARFHGCLVEAMKQVIFEAPTGDGRVEVVYPVVFRPAGANAGDDPGTVIAP